MHEEVAASQPGAGLYSVRTGWPGSLQAKRPDGVPGGPQSPGQRQTMTDICPAVVDLQSRWHNLRDVDRALAVQSLHREGTSLWKLARHLNYSPSLLSRLLQAAQAPAADRARARRGEMSTRALARRASVAGTCITGRYNEAIAFEHEQAVYQASQSITEWFEEEGVPVADREQIIEKARLNLVKAGQPAEGRLKILIENMLFDKAARQLWSPQIETGEDQPVTLHALSLALWTVRRIPDQRVHDRALELARGERTQS